MSRRKKNRLEKLSDSQETDSFFGEPVVVPIEDSIDLHAFAPRDIPSVVEEYLEQCGQGGLMEVRIIHGRGTGVQRDIVRSILQRHPRVLCFQDAPAGSGWLGRYRYFLENTRYVRTNDTLSYLGTRGLIALTP